MNNNKNKQTEQGYFIVNTFVTYQKYIALEYKTAITFEGYVGMWAKNIALRRKAKDREESPLVMAEKNYKSGTTAVIREGIIYPSKGDGKRIKVIDNSSYKLTRPNEIENKEMLKLTDNDIQHVNPNIAKGDLEENCLIAIKQIQTLRNKK